MGQGWTLGSKSCWGPAVNMMCPPTSLLGSLPLLSNAHHPKYQAMGRTKIVSRGRNHFRPGCCFSILKNHKLCIPFPAYQK